MTRAVIKRFIARLHEQCELGSGSNVKRAYNGPQYVNHALAYRARLVGWTPGGAGGYEVPGIHSVGCLALYRLN